jgi:hypothetical protein
MCTRCNSHTTVRRGVILCKSLQVPHAKLQDAFQLTAQLYLNPSVRCRPRALLQAQSFFKRRQHEHQFKKITSFHLGDAKERITKETEQKKNKQRRNWEEGIKTWCSMVQYGAVHCSTETCLPDSPRVPTTHPRFPRRKSANRRCSTWSRLRRGRLNSAGEKDGWNRRVKKMGETPWDYLILYNVHNKQWHQTMKSNNETK